MAVWGCGTFIAMLNIGITLKGFHQYTLRTKYWKYFELEFLFSVNCINGFFGFGFVLGLVFHLIFGEIFSALWNQDCFYCSPEDICVLKPPASPPAASLETTVSNGGWKEGAEAVSWMLLEIPDCMNKLFKRQFSRKVPLLQEVGEAQVVPPEPRGDCTFLQIPHSCDPNPLFPFIGVPAPSLSSS